MELDGLRNDTPYFANLIDASMRAGKYREGLEALNRHADYVETRPALQADRAFLQGQLGDIDLAITNYARLFANGFNDDAHFREYVGLLVQGGQWDRVSSELKERAGQASC